MILWSCTIGKEMGRRSTDACLERDHLNFFFLQSSLSPTVSSLLTHLLMQEENIGKILTLTPQHSTFFTSEFKRVK